MIRVTVLKDSNEDYKGIILDGHAGYGKYGQDIVCASVSALVFNTANSVEALTDDSFEGSAEEEKGRFSFRFTGELSPESKLLMNSLVLGLQNIEKDYGRKYISIRFEEV